MARRDGLAEPVSEPEAISPSQVAPYTFLVVRKTNSGASGGSESNNVPSDAESAVDTDSEGGDEGPVTWTDHPGDAPKPADQPDVEHPGGGQGGPAQGRALPDERGAEQQPGPGGVPATASGPVDLPGCQAGAGFSGLEGPVSGNAHAETLAKASSPARAPAASPGASTVEMPSPDGRKRTVLPRGGPALPAAPLAVQASPPPLVPLPPLVPGLGLPPLARDDFFMTVAFLGCEYL